MSTVVVLASGGLDSTTVLALAAAGGHTIHALSYAYGQRHAIELECARRQARRFGAVSHETVDLGDLGRLVRSATSLVSGSPLAVPQVQTTGIPTTYVPARNSVFLVHALAWAETIGAAEIHIGINAIDSSGYPDCTPRFVDAFERLAEVATRRGVEGDPVRVHAPLLHLGKHEIVQLGVELGVDHADTVSCYDPSVGDEGPLACGSCESCRLRREGFLRAGVPDPTRYR